MLHPQTQRGIRDGQHSYKCVIRFSLISNGFQNGSINPHMTTPTSTQNQQNLRLI